MFCSNFLVYAPLLQLLFSWKFLLAEKERLLLEKIWSLKPEQMEAHTEQHLSMHRHGMHKRPFVAKNSWETLPSVNLLGNSHYKAMCMLPTSHAIKKAIRFCLTQCVSKILLITGHVPLELWPLCHDNYISKAIWCRDLLTCEPK